MEEKFLCKYLERHIKLTNQFQLILSAASTIFSNIRQNSTECSTFVSKQIINSNKRLILTAYISSNVSLFP